MLVIGAGCRASGTASPGTATADDPPPAKAAFEADTAFTSLAAAATPAVAAPETRLDIVLRVLRVQVPRAARPELGPLWAQLREDVLDSHSQQRLTSNGVRVGIGRTERWDDVEAILGRVEHVRRTDLPPLRTPPGSPLGLELDTEQRDYTIFYVDQDGVISGSSWPDSRRVLRLMYALDARDLSRVFLSVVPEIRRQGGPDWLQSEGGWTPGVRREGRAFAAAGFVVPLGPNEFALLGPGQKSDVFGLVGGMFLKDTVENRPYDSYLFVRVEVSHVDQRR